MLRHGRVAQISKSRRVPDRDRASAGSAGRSNTRSLHQLHRQRREQDAVAVVRRRIDQARHRRRARPESARRPVPSGEGRCERRSSRRRPGPARAIPPRPAASPPPRRCVRFIEADIFDGRSDQHRSIRPRHQVPVGPPDDAANGAGLGLQLDQLAADRFDRNRIGAVHGDCRRPAAGGEHHAIGFRACSTTSARRRDRPGARRSESRRWRP